MAFEVYAEDPDTESEDDTIDPSSGEPSRPLTSREDSVGPGLAGALSNLKLSTSSPKSSPSERDKQLIHHPNVSLHTKHRQQTGNSLPPIKTSLSLLEMLLKLAALQQFRQESHLSIEDELLNFFLEDTSTAGAGLEKQQRQRARNDAVRRVGFDPYDESPVKRRGEEYIRHAAGNGVARTASAQSSPRTPGPALVGFDEHAFAGRLPYGDVASSPPGPVAKSYDVSSPLGRAVMSYDPDEYEHEK
ncbi:MAG: hypothetical protein Q9224_007591 [Gallowayella concinna]